MAKQEIKDLIDALRLALEAKSEASRKEEGVQLIRRLEKAEKTFPRAYRTLSHINTPAGRKKIVRILKREGYNIRAEDLEGAVLVPSEPIIKEMKEKYGLRAFPLAILIPEEKWASKEKYKGVDKKLNVKGKGGVLLPIQHSEIFKDVGTIAIISPNIATERHETLHSIQRIYRPKEFSIEKKILGEFFAELSRIKNPQDWLYRVNNNPKKWNAWIKHYSGGTFSAEDRIKLLRKIKRAGEGLAYLHSKTSESIVAQTILNSESLDELARWKDFQLQKYKDAGKERAAEAEFCREVAQYYKSHINNKKYRKAQTLLYGYRFMHLNKQSIKTIVEKEYSRKIDGWKHIQA